VKNLAVLVIVHRGAARATYGLYFFERSDVGFDPQIGVSVL